MTLHHRRHTDDERQTFTDSTADAIIVGHERIWSKAPWHPFYLPMTITIYLPSPLRAYCNGAAELKLSAPSVRAALEQIEQSHPALYRSICDETGKVRRHVNVFVNTCHVRDREGLDTALVPGDTITVLPAVSGGST